jgi:hypothetical protein
MAYTVSRVKTVFGDKRSTILNITADAATQTVETGLSVIEGHTLAPKSLSTAAIKVYPNSSASGVAAMGSLGISGCVSGDEFCVIVYGR